MPVGSLRSEPTGTGWLTPGRDARTASSPGGVVHSFTAAEAMNVGDEAALKLDMRVCHQGSDSQSTIIGRVVGGKRTKFVCASGPEDIGQLAASTGQTVQVLVLGVAWKGTGLVDAALTLVAPGAMAVALPAQGRSVGTLSEFLANSADFNIEDYGKIVGAADAVGSIQRAINAAFAAGGGRVTGIRGKVYNLATVTVAASGFLDNYFLLLKSNVILDGISLRIADHIFDQIPDATSNGSMVRGEGISNAIIRNCIFDGNAPNNLTPSGHMRNGQGAVFVNGDNIRIVDNTFLNCAGHNQIAFGRTLETFRNSDVWIERNTIRNGGLSAGGGVTNTYNQDYSAVYTDWDNSHVNENNIFHDFIDIALMGPTGGIEIHGSDAEACDNNIEGHNPAIFIVPSTAPNKPAKNIRILRNKMKKCLMGPVVYAPFADRPLDGIIISQNEISLYQPAARTPGATESIGIQFDGVNTVTAMKNVTVTENIISSEFPPGSPQYSTGILLDSVNGCIAAKNQIRDMQNGGIAVQGSIYVTRAVRVEENEIWDCGRRVVTNDIDTAGFSKYGIALNFLGGITHLGLPYIAQNIIVRRNRIGNSHDMSTNICDGSTINALWAPISAQDVVENILVEDNETINLTRLIAGANLPSETINPQIKIVGRRVRSGVKPVSRGQFFTNEIVLYDSDNTSARASVAGWVSPAATTGTTTAGSNVVPVASSANFRVGMVIGIAGVGFTNIVRISGNTLYVNGPLGTSVVGAAITVFQPTFV